ncbi:uncharacterized protein LOC129410942 [Boleophthalmus pectinirostris]|uniref:uncharacterized protein LOC129410942 n=1 Tax=Boleophthalmus pectinirostris TaxID=150288 RepID=UPI00242B1174|nr:uncharacterized protein LOC129410942 [Boleophthalmus pectinirostris]
MFNDEPCNRHRGLPQMLFYKPTVKVPSETLPEKASLRDEVILKAQDATSFFQMLHCYARKPKGKKVWTKTQGSSSTITRSSGQLDPPNKEQLSDKSAVEMKVTISSQTPQVTDKILRSTREKCELPEKTVVTKDADIAIEPKITGSASLVAAISESDVEVEVKVAAHNRHSPKLEKTLCTIEHISNTNSNVPRPEKDQISYPLPPVSTNEEPTCQDPVVTNQVALVNGTPNKEDLTSTENSPVPKDKPTVEVDSTSKLEAKNIVTQKTIDNANKLPAITVETAIKTEMPQNQEDFKDTVEVNSAPTESKIEKDNLDKTTSAPPSDTAWEDDGFDPMEPQPECEESKLEFCCHFCHKDVKGRHLVAHAMFHYRKDECMFCGVTFRNNLKAMIHLSNHLEKLKKLQNPTAAKSPEKPRTKDKQKHKTGNVKMSSKTKTVLNEKRGRKKKPIPPVRKLRSGYKFRHAMQQEQGSSKDMMSKAPIHKANGHFGRRKENDSLITKTRLRRRSHEIDQNNGSEHNVAVKIEKEEPVLISSEPKLKQKKKSKVKKQWEINKNIDSRDKLCCPVDGCQWFTVKNQVALFVHHALEDHYSNTRPLELAFHMSNNKCSICKRVLYSFEHFQHHVERHRFVPRHPCPHKGCTARFKTTIEMRRHARKHSPLQAMCCLPGCPKLFICLWQLILHEKDHYSIRSKATQKEKPERTQIKQEKQEDVTKKNNKSNKNVSSSSISKSHSNDTKKTKDSTIHKKKLSAQSAAATRLLQKLRKRQIIKNNMVNNQQIAHKIVSSVGKPNNKLHHSLQKKGNRSKQCLSSKVLPPRQAKTSLNNSSKIIQSQKESKTSVVHKRKEKEGEKNTARPKAKVDEPESVAKIRSTGKILKRNSNFISERAKSAGKVEPAAPVVDRPVMEENANMDTTDTTDNMVPVSDTKSSNDSSEDMEMAICKEETSNIVEIVAFQCEVNKTSKTTSDGSKIVVENVNEVLAQNEHIEDEHAPVVKNVTETKIIDTETFRVEKYERESAADFDNSELKKLKMTITDSSEIDPINCVTIVNTDEVNEVVPGKVTEENSNMADSISSSKIPINPLIIMPLVQNVASPQNAEGGDLRLETTDHVTEPPPVTSESEFMQDSNEESALTKMADTSTDNTNHSVFENMTEMKKCEQTAADLIMNKMESTDLATNEKEAQSSATTSKTEQVELKDVEMTTTEGDSVQISVQSTNGSTSTSNSLNEKSVESEKRKSKLGNKNEILSALKTLVKSKKDKTDQDSPSKRKNEVDNSPNDSKKFKSDTQTEVGPASVEESSTSEGNQVQTTDSAPAANSLMCVNVNETPKEKDKVVKIRQKNKVDLKMKSNLTNKKADKKQTKLEKKPGNAIKNDKTSKKMKKEKSKSETKTVKPKSHKIPAKTTDSEVSLSSSSEVNGEPVPTDGNSQTSIKQGSSDKNVNTKKKCFDKVKPTIPKKAEDKTCLKDHSLFDFVPVEEESPLATFEKALSEYKKKPYMRLPATAYLEERFTVMPKRRKDMSMFFGTSRKVPKTPEASAQVSQQRQRCANCFTTFSSEQELQWHLQQKCSSLFGFDSDDEGTS